MIEVNSSPSWNYLFNFGEKIELDWKFSYKFFFLKNETSWLY